MPVPAAPTTFPASGYGEYATTLCRKWPLRVFAVPAPLPGARCFLQSSASIPLVTRAPIPTLGKIRPEFSNVWKIERQKFQPLEGILPTSGKNNGAGSACFQRMEKRTPFFPMLGKRNRNSSNVWKKSSGLF